LVDIFQRFAGTCYLRLWVVSHDNEITRNVFSAEAYGIRVIYYGVFWNDDCKVVLFPLLVYRFWHCRLGLPVHNVFRLLPSQQNKFLIAKWVYKDPNRILDIITLDNDQLDAQIFLIHLLQFSTCTCFEQYLARNMYM